VNETHPQWGGSHWGEKTEKKRKTKRIAFFIGGEKKGRASTGRGKAGGKRKNKSGKRTREVGLLLKGRGGVWNYSSLTEIYSKERGPIKKVKKEGNEEVERDRDLSSCKKKPFWEVPFNPCCVGKGSKRFQKRRLGRRDEKTKDSFTTQKPLKRKKEKQWDERN